MGMLKPLGTLAILSALAMAATCWGFGYNWPDNVHVDYGLPLVWGVHTLNTIAGPVDLWSVNIGALALDLIVWLAIILCASALLELTRRSG